MRTEMSNESYFNFAGASSLKIVDEYREKYEMLSNLLDANPDLVATAHADWVQWLLRLVLKQAYIGALLLENLAGLGWVDRWRCGRWVA